MKIFCLMILSLTLTDVSFARTRGTSNQITNGEKLLATKLTAVSECVRYSNKKDYRSNVRIEYEGNQRFGVNETIYLGASSTWGFHLFNKEIKQKWLQSGRRIEPNSLQIVEQDLKPESIIVMGKSSDGHSEAEDLKLADENGRAICEAQRAGYLATLDSEDPAPAVNDSERSSVKDEVDSSSHSRARPSAVRQ